MFAHFEQLQSSIPTDTVKTLVVAAAHDEHTLEAVYHASNELPLRYILVGDREKINKISSDLGRIPSSDAIIDGYDDADCARKAVSLIRENAGDVLMKGFLETGTLLKAVLDKDAGIRESETMSHLAILEVPAYHKLIGVTDGGMIPAPTPEQKADIVRNTIGFYKRLSPLPLKCAALCAAESVNPKIHDTLEAAQLQTMCEEGAFEDCLLEGPLSFDIAVNRESASIKGHPSKISGDTDVFLVPNITVGNALCKGLIFWGGAKMAGCVLGAKTPIIVVSRGATAEEKFFSIMLCLK